MHAVKEKNKKRVLRKGKASADFPPGSSIQPLHSLSYIGTPPGSLRTCNISPAMDAFRGGRVGKEGQSQTRIVLQIPSVTVAQ